MFQRQNSTAELVFPDSWAKLGQALPQSEQIVIPVLVSVSPPYHSTHLLANVEPEVRMEGRGKGKRCSPSPAADWDQGMVRCRIHQKLAVVGWWVGSPAFSVMSSPQQSSLADH